MFDFLSIPFPGPTMELYGAAKICIEKCDDETYIVTQCERIGNEEWRPVGTPEHYDRNHLEFEYHIDPSQLD